MANNKQFLFYFLFIPCLFTVKLAKIKHNLQNLLKTLKLSIIQAATNPNTAKNVQNYKI